MKWTDKQCSVCGRDAKDGEMFLLIVKPIEQWTKFMDGQQYCQECYNKQKVEKPE